MKKMRKEAFLHYQKLTDVNEIAGYGVFITPGLVVDGEVKLAGKVATKDQIKKILSE